MKILGYETVQHMWHSYCKYTYLHVHRIRMSTQWNIMQFLESKAIDGDLHGNSCIVKQLQSSMWKHTHPYKWRLKT